MIQLSKTKYPDKQTINLAIQNTSKLKNSIQIGCFLIFLLFLTMFVKIAVMNRIKAAIKAEQIYKATEEQIQLLQEKTEEYDEILEAYRMYVNAFYDEGEAAEVDRIEIISLVESCVMNYADIRNMNIVENTLIISLENTSLPLISEIVAAFQADDRTANVTVTTASKGEKVKQDRTATANIIVKLKARGEE